MNQVNPKKFLATLSEKDRKKVQLDIQELKKRIWERVALPPVPDS